MIVSQKESLSHEQQLFLHWILSQRCVPFEDALNYIRGVLGLDFQESDFITWVRPIFVAIKPFSLQLGKRYFDEGDDFYLAIWNTLDDKISQLATTFSSTQTDAFKAIISMCLDTESHGISSTQAIHEIWERQNSRPGTHTSKTQIQHFVNELIELSWLFRRPDDTITLGPRTKFELHTFLRRAPDADAAVNECYLCKEIVTTFKTICCDDEECAVILHLSCFERFHNIQSNVSGTSHSNCPQCSKPLQ